MHESCGHGASQVGVIGKIVRSQSVECKDTMNRYSTIRIEERIAFNAMKIQTTLV